MDSDLSFPESWTAPAELMRALPRKIRIGKGGIQIAVLGTLLAFLGGACFLLYFPEGLGEIVRAETLNRRSREADGVVTRLWSRHRTDMVSYTFTVDGVVYAGECTVANGHGASLRSTSTLRIRFLPSNPATNYPSAWGPRPDWWVPSVFTAFLAGIGIWLILQLRRDRRLAAEGAATAGVVLRCSARGRGGWTVNYQFRTEDGRVLEGSGDGWKMLERGSTICILYLRDAPRCNQPYETLTYCVAE